MLVTVGGYGIPPEPVGRTRGAGRDPTTGTAPGRLGRRQFGLTVSIATVNTRRLSAQVDWGADR